MDKGDLRGGFERLITALRMPQNSPMQSASAMTIAAHLAVCINAPETAAILYGFSDGMMLEIGQSPEVPQTVRADVSVLRHKLGESYNRYNDQGRTLSRTQALALVARCEPPANRTPDLASPVGGTLWRAATDRP
jgi:hypothetical protein